MRHYLILLLGGAMASLLAIPQVLAFFAQNKRAEGGELRERDEIRRTFHLAPGARVEVSNIRGPVEIETADTDEAEVSVVRSAQSRAELEQYKVSIENTAQGLTVRGEQPRRDSGQGPEVRHHVTLKLPRRINLSIQRVGGDVKVGDVSGQLAVSTVTGALNAGAVDGQVRIDAVGGGVSLSRAERSAEITTVTGDVKIGQASDSLNITGARGVSIGRADRPVKITTVTGDVNIGQASDSLNVTGVSGTLSAGISKLGPGGVRITTVTGQVELRFSDELNAQLSTDTIVGGLSLDVPNVTVQSRPGASSVRAQIGKGGPPISINSVSKSVRLVKGS